MYSIFCWIYWILYIHHIHFLLNVHNFYVEFIEFCTFSISSFYNSVQKVHSFFIRIHEKFELESMGATPWPLHSHSTLSHTPIRTLHANLHFFSSFSIHIVSGWNRQKLAKKLVQFGPKLVFKKKREKKIVSKLSQCSFFFSLLEFH